MSRPPNRRGPGRVPVQIARPGGSVDATAGAAASAATSSAVSGNDEAPGRGRHRSPDGAGGAGVIPASSLVGAPRHRRARREPDEGEPRPRTGGLPARSLARVDAARDAAAHPTPAGSGHDRPAPGRPAPDRPAPDEEAVTDLVARPGRGGLADGPGSGTAPAVAGLVVSVVAVVAALVTAPLAGSGGSRTTLLITLALAVLGTATAALGLGRQRRRRGLAAAGVAVGLAAVLAGAIPLLAL